MAHTNETENYDLSQFIVTDKPGWLTDYNGDMRKLDTALKGVSDVASGASGSISSLADRMTAAEGAINTNANDIDALEARADVLEAQAQSSAGAIAGIQTEQTVQNAGIEAATELGYNLARPYDSASTYAVGAYVLFQNTLYKCITAVSTGEAFDPTKWLAIKATDEFSSGGVSAIEVSNPITFDLENSNCNIGTLTLKQITDIACIKLQNLKILKMSYWLAFNANSTGGNGSISIPYTQISPEVLPSTNNVRCVAVQNYNQYDAHDGLAEPIVLHTNTTGQFAQQLAVSVVANANASVSLRGTMLFIYI